MTWENVDLERRIMTVTGVTAKSKRTRHIPLNREATSVLQVGATYRSAARAWFS